MTGFVDELVLFRIAAELIRRGQQRGIDGRPGWTATSRGPGGRGTIRGGRKLAYVAMVHGGYARYIGGYILRAKAVGIQNVLVMYCQDEAAVQECVRTGGHLFETDEGADARKSDGHICFRGHVVSVLNKIGLPLALLQLGLDVMWLDMDVFLGADPTGAVYNQANGVGTSGGDTYDLLIQYDFQVDCVCNGVFWVRSTPTGIRWMRGVLAWLYDHPYEEEQNGMSAFLGYTVKTASEGYELPVVPKWHVLDTENRFPQFAWWTGDMSKVILIHFLRGHAAILYGRQEDDASVPKGKSFDGGRYSNMMDVAFGWWGYFRVDSRWWEGTLLSRLMEETRLKGPMRRRGKCGGFDNAGGRTEPYGWVAHALHRDTWGEDLDDSDPNSIMPP